jgi:hypothetical protein
MMRGPERVAQQMRNRTEYADHRGLSCLRNTSKILSPVYPDHIFSMSRYPGLYESDQRFNSPTGMLQGLCW